MGEYARFNGHEIKIGTCADMYYLRFEQKHMVEWLEGNVHPVRDAHELRFRLPFPDEDGIEPGGFDEYNRFLPLHKGNEWFSDPETAKEPLTIQLTHKCGYLVNLPCYHGERLPEGTKDIGFHWNGKDPGALVLSSVRGLENGSVAPVVRCKFCGNAWRYTWAQVLPFVADVKMRERFERYAKAELMETVS